MKWKYSYNIGYIGYIESSSLQWNDWTFPFSILMIEIRRWNSWVLWMSSATTPCWRRDWIVSGHRASIGPRFMEDDEDWMNHGDFCWLFTVFPMIIREGVLGFDPLVLLVSGKGFDGFLRISSVCKEECLYFPAARALCHRYSTVYFDRFFFSGSM